MHTLAHAHACKAATCRALHVVHADVFLLPFHVSNESLDVMILLSTATATCQCATAQRIISASSPATSNACLNAALWPWLVRWTASERACRGRHHAKLVSRTASHRACPLDHLGPSWSAGRPPTGLVRWTTSHQDAPSMSAGRPQTELVRWTTSEFPT